MAWLIYATYFVISIDRFIVPNVGILFVAFIQNY